MNRAHLLSASLWPALFGAVVAACALERTIDHEGGVHPPGFARKEDPEFHGDHLRRTGFEMEACRLCHGDDYTGGPVGFSCNQASCHTNGVEWCGTCHEGGRAPPEPVTGGHGAHLLFGCESCHLVPKTAREYHHPNGALEVELKGLAEAQEASPAWSPDERRCQNTYCHGSESPPWDSPPGPLPCDGCHGAPPESHARFPVAEAPAGCTPCHPSVESEHHLDGVKDDLEPSCAQCHGQTPDGAPPPALDGSTSPTSRGVGAHTRHLDDALRDRIGRAAECDDCHDVPASMRAEGHMDDGAPADVRFYDGDYDPVAGSCVVGCHWDRDPGPVWTDTSPATTACDGCHGMPPEKTRKGTPHPAVEPTLPTCQLCHLFAVPTHVDGKVDFLQ